MKVGKENATLAGSIVAGILASICCIGPLVLAMMGLSGAALAQRFEPFRPVFLVLSYGLLGVAFYFAYRPVNAECGPEGECSMPRANRLGRLMLWVAAVIVVAATAFPLYSRYLFSN